MSAIFPVGDTGLTFGADDQRAVRPEDRIRRAVGSAATTRVESDVKIVDLTLSASLDITDRFSVGVGADLRACRSDPVQGGRFRHGDLRQPEPCRPASPRPPPCTARSATTALAGIKGDDTGFGWIAGVHWRPTDKLTIGYSHRSEIDHDLDGTPTFDVPRRAATSSTRNPFPPARNVFADTDVQRQADHAEHRHAQRVLAGHRSLHAAGRRVGDRLAFAANVTHRLRQPCSRLGRAVRLGRHDVLFARRRVRAQRQLHPARRRRPATRRRARRRRPHPAPARRQPQLVSRSA